MQGVEGVHRFLQRVWRLVIDQETGKIHSAVQDAKADEQTLRILHQTIKKVTGDIEGFAFNTAISQMMIFVNHVGRLDVRPKEVLEKFVLTLAPFAPHLCEELWQTLGTTRRWRMKHGRLTVRNCAKRTRSSWRCRCWVRSKIRLPSRGGFGRRGTKGRAGQREGAGGTGRQDAKKIIVIKSRLVNIVV
jgi:leucyl-tRNA synthetase